MTDKDAKDANQIRLASGQPIRFGAESEYGIVRGENGNLKVVEVAEVGAEALLVHDPHRGDPGLAFSLCKLAETPTGPTPIGIFRDVQRPVYGRHAAAAAEPASDAQLEDLLLAGDTWTVA